MDDLTREDQHKTQNSGQDGAADEQPSENVDVHVHVARRLSRLSGLRYRREIAPALAAKFRMFRDFVTALWAKHVQDLQGKNGHKKAHNSQVFL